MRAIVMSHMHERGYEIEMSMSDEHEQMSDSINEPADAQAATCNYPGRPGDGDH